MSRRRVPLAMHLMAGLVLAGGCAKPPAEAESTDLSPSEIRERLRTALEERESVALQDLKLPLEIAERIDANHDSSIERSEAQDYYRRASRGPRDRSDFTMLREEGFPLNVNPELISAGQAEIGDDDLVMGIVHNGEARAYPVNYMNGPTNEVVNDVLGGTAIAPSW